MDSRHPRSGGDPSRTPRINRTIRAEASAWIAKLHGPERSPELEEDFRAWLKARPEHARAFEHITEIWDAVGNVNVGGLPRLATDDPFELRREAEITKLITRIFGIQETRRPNLTPPHALIAVAATLLLAAIGFGTWHYLTRGQYTTDIGEQRIVSLDDGSRLYLNSDTKLNVDLEQHTRRIQLQRGEAYFEVAKDPARPFIVTAGDRTVTAIGTSFVVRYDPQPSFLRSQESSQPTDTGNILSITLVEGKVTVAPISPLPLAGEGQGGGTLQRDQARHLTKLNSSSSVSEETQAPALSTVTLTPGQRITFEQSGTAEVDTPRPETTAAWRRGEVVLDETPLASAIEEMNRYQRQRLTLDDFSIGELPISGIYRTGNNQDFAQAVAAVYGLEVNTDGNEIHLRRRD